MKFKFALVAPVFLVALMLSDAAASLDPFTLARSNAMLKGQPVLVEFISRNADHASVLDRLYYRDAALRSVMERGYFRGAFEYMNVSVTTSALTDRRRVKEQNSYVPASLNPIAGVMRITAEEYPEVVERLRIVGLPQFCVISPSGEIIARREGMMSLDEMTSFLSNAAATLKASSGRAVETPFEETMAERVPQQEIIASIPWSAEVPREPVVQQAAAVAPSASPQARTEAVVRNAGTRREVFTGRFNDNAAKEFLYERTFSEGTLWTIQLKTTPQEYDLDLEILDQDGKSLILSEDQTGQERITIAAGPEGTYTLRVFSFKGEPEGTEFEVKESFEPLPSGRVIPGIENAVIAEGNAATVRLMKDANYWVRLSVTPPGKYNFAIDQSGVREGTEEALVIAADGTVLGRIDGGADAAVVEIPQAGRVFMMLRPGSGAPKGVVSVKAERFTGIDAASVGMKIVPGDKLSGSIGGRDGNERVYRISAGAGRYDLKLEAANSQTDIDLEVITAEGTLIERSEAPSGSEKITVELEDGAELFARVYVYRNTTPVAYELEMAIAEPGSTPTPGSDEPPAGERPPEVTELLDAETVKTGSITQNGNIWYRIEPDRAGLLAFFLDGADDAGDIDLGLYSSDGTQIIVSQSNFAKEAILWKVQANETYYIRIYAYGESAGGAFRTWYQKIAR